MDTTNILGDGVGFVELIKVSGCDKDVVNAARVSFGADAWGAEFNELKDYPLLKYLLRHEHGSPFEHNQLIFRIKAPLFVHAHFVKHRSGVSINSESYRYTTVSEQYYVPQTFRKQSPSNRQASLEEEIPDNGQAQGAYGFALAHTQEIYQLLLRNGVSREQARGILPVATYTTFIATFNLRSLLHFLKLRDADEAQWETRQYAKSLRYFTEPHFPFVFKAIAELEQSTTQ